MIGRLPVLLLSGVCVASMAHAQEAQPLTPSQAEVTATTAAAATAVAATPAAEAAAAPAPTAAPPAPRVAPVVRSASAVDMSKEYLIGPEDVLDITVWKNCPDLCRTVP